MSKDGAAQLGTSEAKPESRKPSRGFLPKAVLEVVTAANIKVELAMESWPGLKD